MEKETVVLVNDDDTIIIQRQFDNKEYARLTIKDALAPRGE